MDFRKITEKFFDPKDENAARSKKMLMIMPVLLIVFIFAVSRAFKSPASCSATVVNSVGGANEQTNFNGKVNWPVPDLLPENLRDPTQANCSSSNTDNSGDIIVKGIMYSIDKPAAVINEKIMHQGEEIAGVKIVKINQGNIEFEKDGKRWTQEVQR